MSVLSTIQFIDSVIDHPNADSLSICKVLGWNVITKKGEFNPGDKAIYIRTDTVVEDRPYFEFLRNKQFRVKAMRLRGEFSEGLLMPLSILGEKYQYAILAECTDVSEIIGVSKYEKPIPACLAGLVKINGLPYDISMTDEERIQNVPGVLDELKGVESIASLKCDGSSGTFIYKNGVFDVCSRKITLQFDDRNSFWRVAKLYNLEEKLAKIGRNVALRGEVVGPGIQGNKMGLKELSFRLFDIFDIDKRVNFNYAERVGWAMELGIPVVPVIWSGVFNFTLKELEELAEKQTYIENGKPAEGIVVRPTDEMKSVPLNGRLSFKVISKCYDANN